ncbi:MAG: transglutaminase family protein [Cyanobacteria bacterium P01_F01_bin.42]
MDKFLAATEVVDWSEPQVLEQARRLGEGCGSVEAIAKSCFEWVRDEIKHSSDYQLNPLTCKASDVLRYGTGYCYAKSHLLAALLRANKIPAGFCYQRLSVDDTGAPYCLHGFNAVSLPGIGWYRVDARGNKNTVNAQFTPPVESLAYSIQFPDEETTFAGILPEPLPLIVDFLNHPRTWDEARKSLPDISWRDAEIRGLTRT